MQLQWRVRRGGEGMTWGFMALPPVLLGLLAAGSWGWWGGAAVLAAAGLVRLGLRYRERWRIERTRTQLIAAWANW